jgi:hypothetical protein
MYKLSLLVTISHDNIHTIMASEDFEVVDGVVAAQVHLPPSFRIANLCVNTVARVVAISVAVGRVASGIGTRVRGRLAVSLVLCYVKP